MQQALYLLQKYLNKFQEKNLSTHWKAVGTKFMSMGCILPAWFIKEYKVGVKRTFHFICKCRLLTHF